MREYARLGRVSQCWRRWRTRREPAPLSPICVTASETGIVNGPTIGAAGLRERACRSPASYPRHRLKRRLRSSKDDCTVPDILRFTGAVERDPAVDEWLDAQSSELGSIARTWFALMRDCGDDVRELVHDGCPTACVQDAPFGYVNVFTAHVNVGFFHGATLPDPARLLDGTGRNMRHVKIRPSHSIDGPPLKALIDAAYRDIIARLG